MPKISVIVPVYNMETEVRDCLDSLVDQTEQDIEIIVIDDQSTDQSLEVLKEYARKYSNIKVYQNERNLGQGETRNRGIELAEGEYVTFLDSDDYINPSMYEELYQIAKQYNFPELITTGLTFVKGREYRDEDLSYFSKGIPSVIHPSENKDAIFSQSPSVCNKLFRKDMVKNYKFLQDCMWEDIAFSFTRFLESDTVVDVPTTNYFYRRDISSGVSARNYHDNKRIDDIFTVADELEEELKRAGKYDEFAPQVRALQIGVCLQRVNEIRQWNSPIERIEDVTEYMFSKMKEKYGTLEGLDEIAIQCKAGFKVTEDYKDYLEKEGTKSVRR